MPVIDRAPRSVTWVGFCTLLVGASLSGMALGQPAGVDPHAESLLKAATTYLAEQKQFSVDTQSTIEAVLASGQKLQFDHAETLTVQRPNKLRAERRGDLVDQVFYYDGKSLTLSNPDDGYYATVAAPASLEDMLDFARETLDIVAPAGDLLYKNAFGMLMQDVTTAFVVGESVVDGVRCTHLAFRAPHTDWQIWVREGAEPLPCKLVITSTDVAGAPQFTVVMTNWNLAPDLGDATFEFTPRGDLVEIDFLTPGESGTSTQ